MPRKRKGANLSPRESKVAAMRNRRAQRTEEQIQQDNNDARVRMAQLREEESEEVRAQRNEARRSQQRQARRFTVGRQRPNDQHHQEHFSVTLIPRALSIKSTDEQLNAIKKEGIDPCEQEIMPELMIVFPKFADLIPETLIKIDPEIAIGPKCISPIMGNSKENPAVDISDTVITSGLQNNIDSSTGSSQEKYYEMDNLSHKTMELVRKVKKEDIVPYVDESSIDNP